MRELAAKGLLVLKTPTRRPMLFLQLQKKTRNKHRIIGNIVLAREFACKKCRALTAGKMCPVCKSTELSKDWSGIMLVFDPERSKIASILEVSVSHKYALKVV